LIEQGEFREDLYYRINAAMLYIPPLKDRIDDIPILIDHFLSAFSKDNSKVIRGVSDNVLKNFVQYDWPGNIRELKNTINYAATMSRNDIIQISDLPSSFIDRDNADGEYSIIEETEKMIILRVLKQADNNKKKAAQLLEMSRKTLYNKMKKYGISLSG
jgi:transcriptional regulator with PAS, ATPase and Fis domain